ncbi:DNA/RNA-binding protein KIN17 [Nilaparvata lugens]|uniref:DNA/RNA-binding protein KIN17 n=1 Tax=Nilaparvata lugens TaxID=108931 RepID=UPI000B991190|nr:DNA/RNA-binding protein KIN17 [Nilaparvata lugens]
MGKHEVGTPKYIANKIKAKGLQKLRWYCQMCQKQCRDENGFKCHTTSESHQRQLLIFADNADKYIDEFSKEFEEGYLELLSRQFGTKRVPANRVYQDYIADRNHLHMNSTQWETLTDFVKWLGREGKCVVDETEKGWFITYIDRNPETIALQEAMARKEKMDKDDHERSMKMLEKQIERGKDKCINKPEATVLLRESEDEKLQFAMPAKKDEKVKFVPLNKLKLPGPSTSGMKSNESLKDKKPEKRKLSALEEIKQEEEAKKKMQKFKGRDDSWLSLNIVVKVMTQSLGDKYYKQKGYVKDIIDRYVAVIVMLDSNHKLKLDQEHLETVIPAIGKRVKLLKGKYKNCVAEMQGLDVEKFSVNVVICEGSFKGQTVDNLPYESVSKLYSA